MSLSITKFRLLGSYALAGFFINWMLHLFDDVPMWTFDGGLFDLMPLNIIGDVVLSWIRILMFLNGLNVIVFTLVGIITIPLIFVVASYAMSMIGFIANLLS